MSGRFRFGVLGPLEAFDRSGQVSVRPAKLRALLALLLISANEVLRIDELVGRLWGDSPPANAKRTLQVYVMRLRALLGDSHGRELIRTTPGGYQLTIAPDAVDLAVFRKTVAAARATADPAARAALLRDADALWRGSPLVDVEAAYVIVHVTPALAEERLHAIEMRVDADLDRGEHSAVVGELRKLVSAHPLRERMWVQLITALWRSGRQADALAAYQDVRRVLADELGVDPGAELRRLHATVLAGGEEIAVPDQATAPAPMQLPLDLRGFVGRAGLAEWVTTRLRPCAGATSVLVLSGPPGVGKTALAVHVAHRVRDHFPDGQLFADLRGYDEQPPLTADQVLNQFLRGIGIPAEQIPLDVDEQAALFRSVLAGRRMLVVLDNAADAEHVRKLLPADSGCAVLVTSRDPLRGLVVTHGARSLTIDVFDAAEAEQLLVDVVGPELVRAEPGAAADLITLCAHLPLALRIAAANITGSIAEYVADLRGRGLAALSVAGDARVAVSAAFDLSYAALDPLAQQAFRLLARLPGDDFGTEVAAVLISVCPATAASVLRTLTDAHLVHRVAPGRFRFHDLIRGYAAALPDSRGVDAVYDWYLSRALGAAQHLYPEMLPSRADGGPFRTAEDALSWLHTERANLVAAISHAADHGPRPLAWQLTDALRGYFWLQTNGTDWTVAAHAGLRAAVGNPQAQALMRHSLGTLYASFHHHGRALEEYDRALEVACLQDVPRVVHASHNNIGVLRQDMGQPAVAITAYETALVIQRAAGHLAAEATTLVNLGSAFWEMGDLTRACQTFNEALVCLSLSDSHQARVEVQDSLARVHLDRGDLNQAHDYASHALASAAHHPRLAAEAHNTLGAVCLRLGLSGDALRHHSQALDVARSLGHRRAEVAALLGLAEAQGRSGDFVQSLEMCRQAHSLVVASGVRSRVGRVLTALASAHLRLGDGGAAVVQGWRAVCAHREHGHRLAEARALRVYAEAVAVVSGEEEARPHRVMAAEIFASLGVAEPLVSH
ncbi:BTAD domain-containing putative transcriptional regulator [Lentzea sp. BCCO 10_0856]|uniref:BTAD domain-containing putative transcriptional regulator n=1 Tax=Lentzea miocenica TaxID=3095431 RepID=A0ABU4T3B3_9PSEU|nr:BTAD domain-containing putative transcriptional regulator [Lentzea sp. BCCO 10_0856]MDX8032659.1 BTAD domain-containing putative transcriptional regulator [Lentzea sp. BCCO 10_0856]